MDKNKDKDKELQKKHEIKELVIARLETLPFDSSLSIGSMGSFTKEELLKAVKENTELGKKITEIQLEYLEMLKQGIFYDNSNSQAVLR